MKFKDKIKTLKYVEIEDLKKEIKKTNPEFFEGRYRSLWRDYETLKAEEIGNGNYGTWSSWKDEHNDLVNVIRELLKDEDILISVYW